MIIIIGLIWIMLSVYIIYYTDYYDYWEHLFKVFAAATLLALMTNGWLLYNPELNRTIVTIELNPSMTLALGVSMIEGICITGPIAGVRLLIHKIKERRG